MASQANKLAHVVVRDTSKQTLAELVKHGVDFAIPAEHKSLLMELQLEDGKLCAFYVGKPPQECDPLADKICFKLRAREAGWSRIGANEGFTVWVPVKDRWFKVRMHFLLAGVIAPLPRERKMELAPYGESVLI